eukprot:TRINITY_DN698_c0_g1_i5.p1 TRINITY_DN698_c0_g1~~TRINITY_DN698_c0_g1_i5.p1  ORF type:complete len:656 (-),score=105.00 TRINITY_DN698_c0_g1_i5:96-2063(-)
MVSDCDGDGILDKVCDDGKDAGFIGSAEGCKDFWPQGNGNCLRWADFNSLSSGAVVTTLTGAIEGGTTTCQAEECAFGTFLCELFRTSSLFDTAPLVIFTADGWATGLPSGKVSVGDLLAAFPFAGDFVLVTLTGLEVKMFLSYALNVGGAFPQVGGLRFQASVNKGDGRWDVNLVQVSPVQAGGSWHFIDELGQYKLVVGGEIFKRPSIPAWLSGKHRETLGVIREAVYKMLHGGAPPVPPPLVHANICLGSGTTCEWVPALSRALGVIDGTKATCRHDTCALGIMMCEGLREFGLKRHQGTQIALWNSGGIRASIPQGDVTLQTMFTIFEFGNRVSFMVLKGSIIKQMLLLSLTKRDTAGFLQVAGLRFHATLKQPQDVWSIKMCQVEEGSGWVPLDDDRDYHVVTNHYLAGGGDGFSILKPFTEQVDVTLRAAMMQYFTEHPAGVSPPVVDNRQCFEPAICGWSTQVELYERLHTGRSGDSIRWSRGPGGPLGNTAPGGENLNDGQYEFHPSQTLDSCKQLCTAHTWCTGFNFKLPVDDHRSEPDFLPGGCQLVSKKIEMKTDVMFVEAYTKIGSPHAVSLFAVETDGRMTEAFAGDGRAASRGVALLAVGAVSATAVAFAYKTLRRTKSYDSIEAQALVTDEEGAADLSQA